MSKFKHYEKNLKGRDFVVGDIHGEFSKLEEELDKIGFNCDNDRCFCVGDLVDRGPESERCLEFLAKNWFISVKGNHEQMAIDFITYGEDSYSRRNGMGWFIDLSKEHRQLFVDEFKKLPIAIDIIGNDDSLYGIVHAQSPLNDWENLEDALAGPNCDGFENAALWSRDRINRNDGSVVKGVKRIFCGHTPLQSDKILGNHHFLDTGACFRGGKLTVVEIK